MRTVDVRQGTLSNTPATSRHTRVDLRTDGHRLPAPEGGADSLDLDVKEQCIQAWSMDAWIGSALLQPKPIRRSVDVLRADDLRHVGEDVDAQLGELI